MMIHNKLVRDLIPAVIESRGATCVTRTLGTDEYARALKAKLSEEVAEYLESEAIEELADILEVVRALAVLDGFDREALEAVCARKERERGAFRERVFLLSVSEET